MKTTIFSVPTLLMLISTAFTSPSVAPPGPIKEKQQAAAEQTSGFTFLRTHRQGKGVTATWGMASYEGVVGFTVERSYDFDPTDPYAVWFNSPLVPCSAGRSASFNDSEVLPGIIHYRVVAHIKNGSREVSEVSTVRIVSRK